MALAFKGFPREAQLFFAELEENNTREWFQPRKEDFDRLVKDPMTELVSVLNGELARFAPEFVTDPKKAIFRIYRDTRFSANKTPYKTHIAASFGRRGMEKLDGGGFYFSVNHKVVEIGGGVYHPQQEALLAIRGHIAGTHETLSSILKDPKLRKRMGELQGEELTRAPKGFDPSHEAIRFIKKKDWVLFRELPPEYATTPKLATEIVASFEVMTPFIEYLNQPLLERKSSRAKMDVFR